ncbi:hypothetical protein IEQ34_009348 [Dendrobium chrysotoxum]|uniref:Uncharacterized protein n=1 Tax=Dendrobium chrysotoxum TaxID=161865 RepID=A0AAV7H1C6_DENCH|nr:hypothetical protein IEQ34_009348 [Dendrobium chrysotoxum]
MVSSSRAIVVPGLLSQRRSKSSSSFKSRYGLKFTRNFGSFPASPLFRGNFGKLGHPITLIKACLVEIREEYVEETQSKEPKTGLSNTSFMSSSKAHSSLVPDEEDMSDLDDDKDDEAASSSEVEDDENASYLKIDEG